MDQIAKYTTHDSSAQFIFVDATETVNQVLHRTGSLPPAGIHLGQALVACYLVHELSAKDDLHRTKLQWSVDGNFGNVYVDVNEHRQGRGTIYNPTAFSGDITESLGTGILQVLRDQQKTHTGIVNSNGDVCTDILEYLHQSEQRRCAMNLWINYDLKSKDLKIKSALGYFFEVFPQQDSMRSELISTFWDEKLAELGTLSKWNIDLDDPIASMAQISLDRTGKRTFEAPISFGCNCSLERAERALAFANQQDKSQDQQTAEIVCEYCSQVYNVDLRK
jgi:redox-regulated HSP33 family molecular chaperone